jgi:hypothetical protein
VRHERCAWKFQTSLWTVGEWQSMALNVKARVYGGVILTKVRRLGPEEDAAWLVVNPSIGLHAARDQNT